MSPEARWPTHVFGKSFLGDDGVKLTREYILSRIFFTRRSIVKSYQSQSSRSAGRGRAGGLGNGGGGIAAPLRTLDAIAGLPASARLGSGRARWRGRHRGWCRGACVPASSGDYWLPHCGGAVCYTVSVCVRAAGW